MKGDAVTLSDLAGRFAILEIACRRCERRGRLRVDRLIEQHGDAELPELGRVLAGDCPRAEAASISDQCDIFFPQLSAF
jgi:hypothetical protein